MLSLRGSRRRWFQAATLGILISFGLVLLWTHSRNQHADVESTITTRLETDQRIISAGTARISKESLGELPSPEVRGRTVSNATSNGSTVSLDPPPVPPSGFTYVKHFGEMSKGRLKNRNTSYSSSDRDRQDWLNVTDLAGLTRQAADAGRDWSFGWIRLSADTTHEKLRQALEGTGAEIVGTAGRMVRARLPGDLARLRSIEALSAVDALGSTPVETKMVGFNRDLVPDMQGQIPVYVTLMADDVDGNWRKALNDLGAVVGGYDATLRVYRANIGKYMVEAIAATDFVQAIEPIGIVRASHDTAVPAMGADAVRTYDNVPGVWSGSSGSTVPVGVMDTGLNTNHVDISTHRASICGSNFAYNSGWHGPGGPLVENEDLWLDSNGHGTHVTGTIVGNGFGQSQFAGMAPGVRHIRFAKVLDTFGTGFGDSMVRGMDFFAKPSGCYDGGGDSERVKPLIVNMSLSGSSRIFEGRNVGARKLDSVVWSAQQLYIVSQGNASISGFSDYGAAKNSLSVGAVMDNGALASFSSHGPTADGRLAPNVVGTGVRVHSARGDGLRGGYKLLNGTSMSTPSVAGVAALLMDAVPVHREEPALTRARLMASAIRLDSWLGEDVGFPTDNTEGPGTIHARFGMGKVSAQTALLVRDQPDGWSNGSATTELDDGMYAWQDIEVPVGASRLDIVMTWDEPPADAITSTVLNDLDLWLDRDGDCTIEACGEYASRSRIDNVEWIIITNPEPGTYRAKILAHRVYTEAPRAALAWTVIRGSSTPTLAIESDRTWIEGVGEHELTLSLSADSYLAAGTLLHIDCRQLDVAVCDQILTIERVAVHRKDSVLLDPSDEAQHPVPGGYTWPTRPINLGALIPIGEMAAGDEMKVTIYLSILKDDDTAQANLHFTASAWNGHAASISVGVGQQDGMEGVHPVNDDFSAAIQIEGEKGTQSLDLLHATSEPGEPTFEGGRGRPAGSVWYEWIAPTDGAFRFHVQTLPRDWSEQGNVARWDRVHIFRGEQLAGLHEVAAGLWETNFFADQGTTYRIRVASYSRGDELVLTWEPSGRPINDNFSDAIVIEGVSGNVDGISTGATLEPGESFGYKSATTWYRWTAPSDDRWRFTVQGDTRVLLFEGDSIPALRLVGSAPLRSYSLIVASAGKQYHIAVAKSDTSGEGGEYSMNWELSKFGTLYDSFADAKAILDDASEHVVDVDGLTTVEPSEPEATGVRTRWWSWQAPMDGTYTWRLEDRGRAVPTYPKLRITMFTGTDLGDLELMAESGPGAPFEFLLDASAGETYWIAAGLGNGEPAAFESWTAAGKLVWGTTPTNDNLENADTISGLSGSVSGSNSFATSTKGEQIVVLGRSTLWWDYEAPTSGWVRFSVNGEGGPWAVTVHRNSIDGSTDLTVISSDRWQRTDNEVLFYAEAGIRYTIALGVRRGGRGGEFTLRWDEADDPGWLRYAGRLVDGDRNSEGVPTEIHNPGALAMRSDGNALYLASGVGLHVFNRDALTGELDQVQLWESDLDLTRSSMLWDSSRDRLLANDCGTWRYFNPSVDGVAIVDEGNPGVEGDPGMCGGELIMDPSSSSVYRVVSDAPRIDVFSVEADGELRWVEGIDVGSYIRRVIISNDGEHVYVFVRRQVLVYQRNVESFELTQKDVEVSTEGSLWAPWPLAISDDDNFLFVFDNQGERAKVFSLEGGLDPDPLATLDTFWDAPFLSNRCRFASVRHETLSVDVLCPGLVYAARYDSDMEQLVGTDWIGERQGDRFNGLPLPDFGVSSGFAISPDDHYLYLSTKLHGLVIIGRGPTPMDSEASDEISGTPDLSIESVSVNENRLTPGGAFMLSATVRNSGDGDSPTTTLHYYRSSNDTITQRDTEVGSDTLPRIRASQSSQQSIRLEAQDTPGTYYYGACVEEVEDESDVENNCSDAVMVEVTEEDTGAPDLQVQSVEVDNANPEAGATFTFTATVVNNGDGPSAATTLRYYRSTDATIERDDAVVGTDPVGALAASESSDESLDLTAPQDAGTYYFGACVDSVSSETTTDNNCSDAVEVVVGNGETSDSYCRDDDVIKTGEQCDIYDTSVRFEVSTAGLGCVRAGGISLCSGNSVSYRNTTLNGETITCVAARNDDNSWTIEDVEPEP